MESLESLDSGVAGLWTLSVPKQIQVYNTPEYSGGIPKTSVKLTPVVIFLVKVNAFLFLRLDLLLYLIQYIGKYRTQEARSKIDTILKTFHMMLAIQSDYVKNRVYRL